MTSTSKIMRMRSDAAELLLDQNLKIEDPILFTVLGCYIEALDRFIMRQESALQEKRRRSVASILGAPPNSRN